jgi:site-specific recombinase XerD
MANKVPLGVLMKLLQHSDIKTTMLYVHINEQMVKDQLIKVDWN